MEPERRNNKNKPLKKKSRHFSEITESRRWWDCGMDEFAEWTLEGSSEMNRVGTDGDRDRYPVAYMSVYEISGLMPI